MNGSKRWVTPEAFSAGTMDKRSSGYFAFQDCADATAGSIAAIAATRMERLIIS